MKNSKLYNAKLFPEKLLPETYRYSYIMRFLLTAIITFNFQLSNFKLAAQSVGIGTATPDASSLLDLTSTSQGLLIPRMTQAQRDAIASPATGLLIYQSNGVPGFYHYTGTEWITFLTATSGWSVLGNSGIAPATYFIGTTDAQDFVIKANGIEAARVLSTGNIGIGTTAPSQLLAVGATSQFAVTSTGKITSILGGMVAPFTRTIYVDAAGKGNYTTIQDAIDDITPGPSKHYKIVLMPGDYRTDFTSPTTLVSYISIEGSGLSSLAGPFVGAALVDVKISNLYYYANHDGTAATASLEGDVLIENCEVELIQGTGGGNTYRMEGGLTFRQISAPTSFQLMGAARVEHSEMATIYLGNSTYPISPIFESCYISGNVGGDGSTPIFRLCNIVGTYTQPATGAATHSFYKCYIGTLNGYSGGAASNINVYDSYINTMNPPAANNNVFNLYNCMVGTYTGAGGASYTVNLFGSKINTAAGTTSMVSAASTGSAMLLKSPTNGTIPAIIKAAAAQTANLQEWENSALTDLAVINAAGKMGLGVSPTYHLDISGDLNLTGKIRVNGAVGTATYYLQSTGTALGWLDPNELAPSDAWALKGKTGTTPGTHYLGTSDAQDLLFKANNTEFMRVLSDGNVGLGTAAPICDLEVLGDITSPGAGTDSEKFGYSAAAAGNYSLAMGAWASSAGANSVAIGSGSSVAVNASASGSGSVVLGNESKAAGTNSISIGYGVTNSATDNSIAIGYGASGSNYSVILGQSAGGAGAPGTNRIAIGLGSAPVNNSIAIGRNATTTAANTIVFGATGYGIVAAAFGKGTTDAAPTAYTIHGTAGSGVDINGADLKIAAGQSTGAGLGGDILFQTSSPIVAGVTLQTLATRISIKGSGNIGINTTTPNSTLQVNGSMIIPISTKVADYTITETDHTLIGDANGGNITLSLPSAIGISGRTYIIKKVDATANTVRILASGAETIDGNNFIDLGLQYELRVIQSDGSNWIRIN